MNPLDLINETFEICAERDIDITAPVFKRFFAASTASYDLMWHADEHMQGRMVEQTLKLLMDETLTTDTSYLIWEVHNHLSYGVEIDMYPPFFAALREAVQDAIGADWRSDYSAAWDARIQVVLDAVNGAAAAPRGDS